MWRDGWRGGEKNEDEERRNGKRTKMSREGQRGGVRAEYEMLKVHKRENFFGSDIGFLSKRLFPIEKWMFL